MRLVDVQKVFKSMIRPLKNRVLLMIGRGVLLATKDSTDIQQMQVELLADEVKDQVESMQNYGYTSHSPKGSDVLGVSLGSNRDHMIIIATEHRDFRFKNIKEGEVAIYTKWGDYIHLKENNVIDIQTKTLNINADTVMNITTPELNINTTNTNLTATTLFDISAPDTNTDGKITAQDDIESLTEVKCPVITAANSLTVGGQEMKNHRHDYTDDGAPLITGVPRL